MKTKSLYVLADFVRWLRKKLTRKVIQPPCDIGDRLVAKNTKNGYWHKGELVEVERMFPSNDGTFWFVRVSSVERGGGDAGFIPSSHSFDEFEREQ